MKLSLVIPCYNESANLLPLLERCKKLVEGNSIEVILVDNGSTDDSPQVLQRLLPSYPGCRSIRVNLNQGYGCGILAGLKSAKGEIIGWTHADMQTDPLDAVKGLELFEKCGTDCFVKGKRFGRPFMDVVFTVGMSLFEMLLLRKWFWDINAQPTMFTREFFETWKSPPNDFSLDLYTYYQARKAGLKVRRFPVRFGQRAFGISHWNLSWTAKWVFIKRTMAFSLELKKGIKK